MFFERLILVKNKSRLRCWTFKQSFDVWKERIIKALDPFERSLDLWIEGRTVKTLDLERFQMTFFFAGKSFICELILALISLGYISTHLKRTFKVNFRLKLTFLMIYEVTA